jgi:hypothetical protein
MDRSSFESKLTTASGTQNFYLDIRKTLLHPWCVESKDVKKKKSNTYAMYKNARSAKLDTLVEILQHHLANDGASAIYPSLGTEKEPSSSPPQPQQEDLGPDRMIVYSFFPSSFGLIEMVSHRFLCQRSEL